MNRLRLALFSLGLLLLAPLAWGQWTEVVHEEPPAELVILKSDVPASWLPNEFPATFKIQVTNGGRRAVLSSGLPGSTRVVIARPLASEPEPTPDGEISDDGTTAVIHIVKATGKVPPKPDDDPDVDPNPDDEDPIDPSVPAPIPEPGFHVLIVFDEAEILGIDQQEILTGEAFDNWLIANCSKEANGQPSYRIYPEETDVSGDLPKWKNAMARVPLGDLSKLPWMIISNGTTGYEGPLPANKAEAISLGEKYKPKTP